ncbi:MAG TPA: serine/threonine-protein kinase [Blastocatellia bacterium]|nr:serine/threonine-protein kinase [Blastocatellia bacterium]
MPELRLENSVVDDRYLVERCLGRGSYAEIFLAYDQADDGRPVIIKALNTSLQGTPDPDLEQTLVENFQNEAIALDRVRHPHIILRLGHGTAADLQAVPFHYLVIEYMPGGDLWSLCRKSPVCLADALFYFQQVAEALAYAHSQKVIHRDIKPNNLLLSADRRVMKIADFGVAKMTHDEASEITRVGTNVYAPPEHHPDARAGDLSEKLTPSADVYSLAKTIYTAITGRAPRQFSREPICALPAELASHTWSAALLAVLARATATRVADRYQSVEAFWEDLARVQSTGAADQEVDDEATIVRSRLRASSEVEQPAARPNFQTLTHAPGELTRPQKARIVVELPGHRASESPREAAAEDIEAVDQKGPASAQQGTLTTQAFGSPGRGQYAPSGSPVKTIESNPGVGVASAANRDAVLRSKQTTTKAVRSERSLSDKMRALITSEWLRRVFILFLTAALIGLAASTYYHFADQKPGLPFFGSATKEGRITGAQNVNLRSDPFGSVLVALPAGTRIRVVEERAGWMKVRILDWAGSVPDNPPDSGWVDGRFVKIE